LADVVRLAVCDGRSRRAGGGGGPPGNTLTRDPVPAFRAGHETETRDFGNAQKTRFPGGPPPPPARRVRPVHVQALERSRYRR